MNPRAQAKTVYEFNESWINGNRREVVDEILAYTMFNHAQGIKLAMAFSRTLRPRDYDAFIALLDYNHA